MDARLVYANHNTATLTFCGWSLMTPPADAKPERCPAGCLAVQVIEDPRPAGSVPAMTMDEGELEFVEECEVCFKPAAEGEEVQIEEAGRTFGSSPGPIVTCSPECSATAIRQCAEDAPAGVPLSAEIAYLEWQFQERQITTRMGWMSEVMGLLASWREAGLV